MSVCVVDECGRETIHNNYRFCPEHWAVECDGLLNDCKECHRRMESDKPLCSSCYRKKRKGNDERGGGESGESLLSATQLGEHVGLKPAQMNRALQEMGWIDHVSGGWEPTQRGLKEGARKKEHQTSNTYVVWPSSILDRPVFKRVVAEFKSEVSTDHRDEDKTESPPGSPRPGAPQPVRHRSGPALTVLAREKFRGRIRTMDGHFVQSRAEALIDNWLYQSKLIHSYEKALPIDGDALCDFYLPEGTTVYIEHWGVKGDPGYDARRQEKQRIYAAASLPLIELDDEHINNLDDYLPRMLIKHQITPRQ